MAMDAKALLDSLMGTSRNADLKEQAKNKGKNFKKDNVCKHYLLGFCPAYELADSKLSRFKGAPTTTCPNSHSDAMKKEFEDSPDFDTLKPEYEKSLLKALARYVADADALADKERGQAKKNESEIVGTTQLRKMPKEVDVEITRMQKEMNKLMEIAQQNAEKGEVEKSKFNVALADEIKSKIEDMKSEYAIKITGYRGDSVCDVCGQRQESYDPKNPMRYEAHFIGVVHKLFEKIRNWHERLKEKHGGVDDRGASSRAPRQNSPSVEKKDKSQDRRRSRSRSARGDPDRGDRDRGDRGNRGDRGDRGDRDRMDRGDRGADRERHRDRERPGRGDRGEDRDRFRDQERGGDRRDSERDRYEERGRDRGHADDRDRNRDQDRGGDRRGGRDRYGDQDRGRDQSWGWEDDKWKRQGEQERGRDRDGGWGDNRWGGDDKWKRDGDQGRGRDRDWGSRDDNRWR